MVEVVLFVLAGLLVCMLWSFFSIVGPSGVHPPPTAAGRDARGRAHEENGGGDEEAATFGGPAKFGSTFHGFGTLEVRPGKLSVRPGVATGLLMRALTGAGRTAFHEGQRVDVYCADMGPIPLVWHNTGVLLRTRVGRVVLVVAGWDRRRLLDRLEAAGFRVVRHDTSVSVAFRALRRP